MFDKPVADWLRERSTSFHGDYREERSGMCAREHQRHISCARLMVLSLVELV